MRCKIGQAMSRNRDEDLVRHIEFGKPEVLVEFLLRKDLRV